MKTPCEHTKHPKAATFWDSFLQHDSSHSGRMNAGDKPIILISDAQAIFRELAYLKRGKENPSAYRELSQSNICEHHAPDWMLKELETSVIPKFSKHYKIQETEVYDWVEQKILPLIQTHEGYSDLSMFEAENSPDIKDAPYVALARDMDAAGVISNDRHFEQFGIRRISSTDLSELLYLARCIHSSGTLRFLGHTGVKVTAGMSAELVKSAINGVQKLDPNTKAVMFGVGIAGIAWWLSSEKGRDQAKSALECIGLSSKEVGKFVLTGANKTHEWKTISNIIQGNYTPSNRELRP